MKEWSRSEDEGKEFRVKNFAEVLPGTGRKKRRKFFKEKKERREIKLGYGAKINGRSTIISSEYVAIIRPLYRIKSLCELQVKDGVRTLINPPSPYL